jgi:hypothetical protein
MPAVDPVTMAVLPERSIFMEGPSPDVFVEAGAASRMCA